MRYISLALCFVLGFVLAYKLIPTIWYRFDSNLSELKNNFSLKYEEERYLPFNFMQIFFTKLQQAGLTNKKLIPIFIVWYAFLPFIIFVQVISMGKPLYLFAIPALFISLGNSYINYRIKKRRQLFGSFLYKIYRFINMQLEAGLTPADIITLLSEAVEHREVKKVLDKMSAAWLLTGDLDLSIQELNNAFGFEETQLLANNLRQCLTTGIGGKTFAQMENLLFSRYLELIKLKSEQVKQLLLAAIILSLMPAIIVVLWPVICETIAALNSVFQYT